MGLPVDFPGTLGKTHCVFEEARGKLSGGLSALAAVQASQVQHALLRSCADACKLLFLAQGRGPHGEASHGEGGRRHHVDL